MRPIQLREPNSPTRATRDDIFHSGLIRRALVIGNGSPSSENQCLGLVRALGLSNNHNQLLHVSTTSFSSFPLQLTSLYWFDSVVAAASFAPQRWDQRLASMASPLSSQKDPLPNYHLPCLLPPQISQRSRCYCFCWLGEYSRSWCQTHCEFGSSNLWKVYSLIIHNIIFHMLQKK